MLRLTTASAADAGAIVERVVADENLNHASRSRPSTRSMCPPAVPAGMQPWKGMENRGTCV